MCGAGREISLTHLHVASAASTPCFEDLVLRGAVQLCFLGFLIWRLVQLRAVRPLPGGLASLPRSWAIGAGACVGVVAVSCLATLITLVAEGDYAPFELLSESLGVVVWALAGAALAAEVPRFASSGRWILPFLWTFALVVDAVRLNTRVALARMPSRVAPLVFTLVAFAAKLGLVGTFWLVAPSDLALLQQLRAAVQEGGVPEDSEAGPSKSTSAGAKAPGASPAEGGGDVEGTPDAEARVATAMAQYMDSSIATPLAASAAGSKGPGGEAPGSAPPGAPTAAVQPHPEDTASCCSLYTFSWMDPLITLGASRPLELEDVYPLRLPFHASVVLGRFMDGWAQHKDAKHSVFKSLQSAFGAEFWCGGVFLLLSNAGQYVSPLLLRELIRLVGSGDDGTFATSSEAGYLLGAGMFASIVFTSVMENAYFDTVIKAGAKGRAALTAAIYDKALRLSNDERNARSLGQISNLMSSDSEKVDQLAQTLHVVWSAPLRIGFGLYLLYQGLGSAAFAGVALLLLAIPAQGVAMARSGGVMKKMLAAGDKRVKAISEVLSGMQVIKLFGYEPAFEQRVEGLRREELGWLWQFNSIMGVILFLVNFNPILLAIGCFGAYAIITGALDADNAFFALSLIQLLYFPILMLPRSASVIIQVNVSMKRIASFLAAGEIAADSLPSTVGAGDASLDTGAISIQDGWFSWESKTPTSAAKAGEAAPPADGTAPSSPAATGKGQVVLQEVNVDIAPGSLVGVVGSTGSGKSSLLSAMLGACELREGRVATKGAVSFASQKAFIINATVRENILFGSPWDEGRYWDVVKACCLEPDLDQWAGRDLTEIGERGVNLSGGQRQRVNMARAVYANSDIVIMDDVLSALDAKVGAQLFRQCVKGFLSTRTRVMATNQLHFLADCDQVVVVADGTVAESGSYADLMARSDGHLQALMAEVAAAEAEAEGDAAEVDGAAEAAGGLDGAAAPAPKAAAAPAQPGASSSGAAPPPAGGSKAKPRRRGGVLSKEEAAKARITQVEQRATGAISSDVYLRYAQQAGGVRLVVVLLLLQVLGTAARVGSNFWLAEWSDDTLGLGVDVYMGVYFALSIVFSLTALATSLIFALGTLAASEALHRSLVHSLLRVPMAFMHSTPLGRVLNRATKDIREMDTQVLFNIILWMGAVFSLLGTAVVVAVVSPYTIVLFVPAGAAFFIIQDLFRRTSRELKRVDAVSRSPLYAHFTETLDGMAVIRAYGAEDRMRADNEGKLDTNISVVLLYFQTNRWLSLRLESLSAVLVLAAAVFAILSRDSLQASLVGLSLSYALTFAQQLGQLVRFSTMAENTFNSVERVLEYIDVDEEAPLAVEDGAPPPSWPQRGEVTFDAVQLKYRPDLPPVLKGVSFTLGAGEKVGLVGRTGAGKSTVFQGLYRIVEPSGGRISIDGVDVSTLGLHDLRRRALAIIPQEPTLFSGTVRSNLDPFDEHSDADVWRALAKAQLAGMVKRQPEQLGMVLYEGGSNLSVGQRQLLCLARALLRHTKVLVVDEATANVDMRTDALIQATIRSEFRDRTTITIAHRLDTIIDCDRIMVLDAGRVLEFDTPKALLADPHSVFSSLVEETGPTMSAFLRSAAQGEVDVAADLMEAAGGHAFSFDNGPLMQGSQEAAATLATALAKRHGPEWEAELAAQGVPKEQWLQLLHGMLAYLGDAAQEAAQEDGVQGQAHAAAAAQVLACLDSELDAPPLLASLSARTRASTATSIA